ncbi:MAG: outer membrane lipoprotein carrier protein LolA [Rhodospirillales bacterium]|nr:MAG: outer membrane lipoprotein carrier protein LolA [Rhodospirillales bacterium]
MGISVGMRRLGAALVVSLIAATSLAAQTTAAPEPARLSPEEQILISQIEDYLNGITTVEAGFVQMSAQGQYAKGKLYLQRPGRMRFEYEPPFPYLLVADGTWFIYVDQELEQVTYLPLGKTPAGLLLRKDFSFSEGLVVTGIEARPSSVRVDVVDSRRPEAGRVSLTLARKPLSLKSWTVHDAQGQRIQVTLIDPRYGAPLDKSLFRFINRFERRPER